MWERLSARLSTRICVVTNSRQAPDEYLKEMTYDRGVYCKVIHKALNINHLNNKSTLNHSLNRIQITFDTRQTRLHILQHENERRICDSVVLDRNNRWTALVWMCASTCRLEGVNDRHESYFFYSILNTLPCILNIIHLKCESVFLMRTSRMLTQYCECVSLIVIEPFWNSTWYYNKQQYEVIINW